MNFPKRDELSFRIVLAFPKDSKIGFDCRICDSIPSLLLLKLLLVVLHFKLLVLVKLCQLPVFSLN